MQILIADDDATLREFVELRLRDLGTFHQASDGSETLAALEQFEIDLLLLDWTMPLLSGLEVLKIIRSRGYQLPVIMVTAECSKSRVLEAMTAGANDYLIKPFEAAALRAKIEKLNAACLLEPKPQHIDRRTPPTSWKVAEREKRPGLS